MKSDLIGYYAQRAQEYESVYEKPERQADITRLRAYCRSFEGLDVLEISCGTGYWTEAIAPVSHSVFACDINDEVLGIARGKDWGSRDVKFDRADSYSLPDLERRFSGGFSGFWWSHIPKGKLKEFLIGFHAKLDHGALVVFIDNRYVEGSSTPISRTDLAGNTYQERKLRDGSVHEVLKNFPSTQELEASSKDLADSVKVIQLEYYWILSYRVK